VITVLPAGAAEVEIWAESLPGQPLNRALRPGQPAILVARVTDAAGNPIVGAPVDFQILEGDGGLGSARTSSFSSTTGALGRVAVDVSVLPFGYRDIYVEARSNLIISNELLIDVIGPPRTSIAFNPTASAFRDGYYLSADTRISLSATTEDPGGIQAIFYAVDVLDPPLPGNVYTGDFSLVDLGLDSPGEHTLRFYAEEQSGAIEPVQQVTLYLATNMALDKPITNRPNPFRAGREPTVILFQPLETGSVTLSIYDLYGNMVLNQNFSVVAGTTAQFVWDGRNGGGDVVGNGGYVCRIQGPGMDLRRKIAVVK
jgi:hypothetical protein